MNVLRSIGNILFFFLIFCFGVFAAIGMKLVLMAITDRLFLTR